MKIPALRLSFPPEDIEWVQAEVATILSTGQLTMGKNVEAFEEQFRSVATTKHAVAASTGTSALEIILRAFDVAGWDVLVPTNTFIATAVAVDAAGGHKIFVDCNAEDLCIDVEDMKRKVTPRTRAVIVVHIGGVVTARMNEIIDFCKARDIFLLEDAAHAHGSEYHGRRAGSLGHAAAFSFFPTKAVTSGEGGMITTDDDGLAHKARLLRTFGRENPLNNVTTALGNNWRLSEFHAVVGRAHLRRLPENLRQRRALAAEYMRLLAGLPWVQVVKPPAETVSSYYKFTIIPSIERETLKAALAEQGVFCPQEVYRLPCHLQPVYRNFVNANCPTAEGVCATHLCLPLYPGMTWEEVTYVVDRLREVGTRHLGDGSGHEGR